jgi:hypothetical protein
MTNFKAYSPLNFRYLRYNIYYEGFFPRLGIEIFCYRWAIQIQIAFLIFDTYLTIGEIK